MRGVAALPIGACGLWQTASHRDGFGPTVAKAFGYEESPTEALEQRLREATLAKDWQLVGRLQPALWASSITWEAGPVSVAPPCPSAGTFLRTFEKSNSGDETPDHETLAFKGG